MKVKEIKRESSKDFMVKIENLNSDFLSKELLITEKEAFEILTRYKAVEHRYQSAIFVYSDKNDGDTIIITRMGRIRDVVDNLRV